MTVYHFSLNGMEAAKLMRSAGYQHLIVGITGHVLDDDIHEYLIAGADVVLKKPLNFRLLKLLLQHIQHHGVLSQKGIS